MREHVSFTVIIMDIIEKIASEHLENCEDCKVETDELKNELIDANVDISIGDLLDENYKLSDLVGMDYTPMWKIMEEIGEGKPLEIVAYEEEDVE